MTFDRVLKARAAGGEAADVADRWFFETVVRIHRAGEGAPYTGLKPAGLDVGPAIPAAERALESGSPSELGDLLCGMVREHDAALPEVYGCLASRCGSAADVVLDGRPAAYPYHRAAGAED